MFTIECTYEHYILEWQKFGFNLINLISLGHKKEGDFL